MTGFISFQSFILGHIHITCRFAQKAAVNLSRPFLQSVFGFGFVFGSSSDFAGGLESFVEGDEAKGEALEAFSTSTGGSEDMGLEDPKSTLVFSCPSHPSVRPSSPRAGSASNSGVGGPETLESLA